MSAPKDIFKEKGRNKENAPKAIFLTERKKDR